MSFLYPRTVSILRPNVPAAGTVGAIGYGGLQPADETVIAAGLAASIQRAERGRASESGLPGTGGRRGVYKVFLPRSVPKGTVRRNDVVQDDEGNRYQVVDSYWNSMGHELYAELMAV